MGNYIWSMSRYHKYHRSLNWRKKFHNKQAINNRWRCMRGEFHFNGMAKKGERAKRERERGGGARAKMCRVRVRVGGGRRDDGGTREK